MKPSGDFLTIMISKMAAKNFRPFQLENYSVYITVEPFDQILPNLFVSPFIKYRIIPFEDLWLNTVTISRMAVTICQLLLRKTI